MVISTEYYAPIAQLVEQLALNETVVGSNPTGRTITKNKGYLPCLFCYQCVLSRIRTEGPPFWR